MRILIIEDDPNLTVFFARALTRAGYEVSTESRGDRGLIRAQSGDFAGLVLDWHLPGLDGMSLLRSLRAQGLDTPVVMLSGSGADAREIAEAAGADAFLGKPCGLDELTAAVSHVTSRALAWNLEAKVA